MKKIVLVNALLLISLFVVQAQQDSSYQFTTVKEIKITPVKNQNRAGTCWSYSGVGLIEAELLRTGKGEHDLSDMFVVNHSYRDKAEKYVRLHGKANFAQGGGFADVLYVFKHYGAIPASLYKGLEYGEENHVHGEMESLASGIVNAVVSNPNKKLTPVWKKAYNGVIDTYLGAIPETFTYKGKEYTPKSYGESLGLNIDDYVSLTSFTHEPFYSSFAIEIEDNWRWSSSYNLPIDELMEVLNNAINNDYTVAWASDVSEKGFTRNGIAVAIDVESMSSEGSDQARWVGLSRSEKDNEIKKLVERPGCKEIVVTQAMRQEAYDNYETTDDHGMLIYGVAKDQNGKKFFMVKNSWGTESKYKGIWYASETFVKYKTINIVLHKDAIPKAIKAKLGLK